MSQNTTDHSLRSEIINTLSISIPLVSSQIVYASSGFIGTAMVAQLGEDALAASVLVNMVWFSMSVFFFGILNAVSVLVAHQYGAKNNRAISAIMGQAFILGLILCIIMIASFAIMPYFLQLSDQPESVLLLSRDYLQSLIWTMPGLVILIIYEQFLAGINRAKIVLRISLLVVPIEIPLIYMLIFGKFGLPVCGISGIGYGFATTYTLTTVFLTYYLIKAGQYRPFAIFANMTKFDYSYLIELIKVGTPMGFMHLIEVSTFLVATFWIAQFGTTMLAAHQIIMQYLSFAVTLVFAMSQAVTVRVGHAVGQNNLIAVRQASYVGMILNFLCILTIAIAFYLYPTFFLRLDINIADVKNAELLNDSLALLSICGVLLIFDNFRIIGFGALRGLKVTQFPMYASFVSFWIIGLGAAYFLAFTWQWEGKGIWWGLTFGIACGAVIVLLKLYSVLKHVDLQSLLSTELP